MTQVHTEKLHIGNGETVRQSVLVLDADLRVKGANPAFLEAFQLSAEHVLGRHLHELGDGQWNIPNLLDLLREIPPGQAKAKELRIAHEFPAIGRRTMQINVCEIQPDNGSPLLILLAISDVTERTDAEESLRSSEARLRALIRSMDDIVFEVDEHGKCISAWTGDPQLLFGLRGEPQVHTIEDFLPAQTSRPLKEAVKRVAKTGRAEDVEYTLALGGGKRWFLARINRIASPEGAPKTLSVMVRDVTARQEAKIALQESEEQFRLLVEGVKDYAIYALDRHGRVVSWNRGAERIKGYRRREIMGRHFSVFYVPEDVAAGIPARHLQIAATKGRFEEVECWRVRKDGSRFYANAVISAIRDEDGVLRGFTKITRDITDRKRAEDAVRQLSGHILRLQDEERRRIARELHDSTAQLLTALSMNLALTARCPGVAHDAQAMQLMTECGALARQAGDEIRDISHLLHPPDLDAVGLVAAIRWYTARFNARTGISVKLNLPAKLCRLPQDNEIALFRVVQESLTNVQRHSGSKTVRIRIVQRDDEVDVEIEDKGHGISEGVPGPEQQSAKRLGVGIAGMRERVNQLGGRLEIVSSPRGTKVKATVSCPPEGALSLTDPVPQDHLQKCELPPKTSNSMGL